MFGQSFKDFELILVDDGSPDKIPEIIDRVKEEHPDIVTVFHKKNEGQSIARNMALDFLRKQKKRFAVSIVSTTQILNMAFIRHIKIFVSPERCADFSAKSTQ